MERDLLLAFFSDLHLTPDEGTLPESFRVHPAYRGIPVTRLLEASGEAHRRYRRLLEILKSLRPDPAEKIVVVGGDLVHFGYFPHENHSIFRRVRDEVREAFGGAEVRGVVGNHDAEEDYLTFLEVFGESDFLLVGRRTAIFFLDAVALLPERLARRMMPTVDWRVWEWQRKRNMVLLQKSQEFLQGGRRQQLAFLHLGDILPFHSGLRKMPHLIFGHHHFGFSLRLPGLPQLHQVGGMDLLGWRRYFKSQLFLVRIDCEENISFSRLAL